MMRNRVRSETQRNNEYAHGTQEWAESNVNLQTGCEHDCRYCYAGAMAIRFGRATIDSWRTPVLNHKALDKRYNRHGGRIMFPSSHDITVQNIDACLTVLAKLLRAGNDLLIVSKPDPVCVKRMCVELEPYKTQILFRFTIGSSDDAVLTYWEPGAPAFTQRLEALKHAYDRGYATSVSMEPMLDSDPGTVIDAVSPYVTDSIWIGKANRLMHCVSLNCPGDTEALARAIELISAQNDEAILRIFVSYKDNPLVRWKDSVKKVVGLTRPLLKGLDI